MTPTMQAFKIIDRESLKKKLDSGQKFHLWNVLKKEYYKEKSIPGSRWTPVNELTQNLPALGASINDEIVVYCGSFTCPSSKQAAQILAGSGYTNVQAYEGGLADWEEAGYSVVAG